MENTTLNYVRDFSAQVIQYRANKSEESLALLNRTASLLSTTLKTQNLDAQQLEVGKFLIDLHALMGNLANDSYALWACINMLLQCSRHEPTRDAIVEQYRFVPMLTYVLERTQAPDKIQKLLMLLQELTYGINISCEEPYVSTLLQKLIQIIDATVNGQCDEVHAQLALSILINMCHKNFVVLFLFLRSVHISSFSRNIKSFGMQGSKLLIILSEDINTPDTGELQLFLRSYFVTICESMEQWHVAQMRHNIDFLLDGKSHTSLHNAMISYAHYKEDIEKILNQLETSNVVETASEEQQLCMSYVFKLLSFLLKLNEEHNLSMQIQVTRIYDLLCPWIESTVCGVEAVRLLEVLIRFGQKDLIVQRMSRDDILLQLIAKTEKSESTAKHITIVLQVLLLLLEQSKMEKFILSRITESYFDKMFAPLLAIKSEAPVKMLKLEEIEKAIFCLLLLVKFADIAKKAYHEKCCNMLQMPQIHQALARAMLHGSQEVCSAIFQMSRFEYFPQLLVAQQISAANYKLQASQPTMQTTTDQWPHLNSILKTHRMLVGRELEERLQALIDDIRSAQSKNQLQNVVASRIVELFSYERAKYTASEQSWQQRMEQTSLAITDLTQRLNMQNAQLQEFHNLNFEILLKQESLQSLCLDLKQQKNDLKRSMTDLMKKMSEKTMALQISEKRLTVSRSEIIVLQQNCSAVQAELATVRAEYDKLQATAKDNSQRIENLKKTIAAYDVDIKEKLRVNEEKERELLRTQKLLEDQKDSKRRADDVIAALEKQLHEKNEQLQSCEQELSETEELRKTIMSLMESKKSKRKA